ncbi:HpcH/HpaI aldolase/citrate lyase family protein [Pseudohaliea rubra]|uniref:Hydroxymethylglutaryl-CoA lyase n=1 Tax=Pseudohaliea rubra DSM 19751 TaxID=1265313 RepID=A0A095XXR1_9GAMM|nr:CoA ester lyase [Pseudohaliea rubra]KGE04526.1 Hydroxymethylglutaryl-CoA lyase [Pseudohaliea rubra DSM 19751]
MPTESAALQLAFRTLLFVPGNRMDRVAKAHDSAADVVCIDLEDAVPAADKDAAREAVLAFLASAATGRTAVRINGLRTRAGLRDLLALAGAPRCPSLLLVPMVESAAELAIVDAVLGDAVVSVVPLVETVEGLEAVRAIGSAPRVDNVMFGGGDLSSQLGVDLAWEPLLQARSQFVLGCVAARVRAIDVPYIHIKDEAGLREETARARALGFAAKAVIHPAQLAPVQEAFQPTAAELARARAAVEAYRQAGGRAIMHDGVMLDEPIVRRYESLLSLDNEADHA